MQIKYPFTVTLAGDSIWNYTGPREVTVSNITIDSSLDEDDGYMMVNVLHDTTWEIYTDSAFGPAISSKLGFDVSFTEQGMQDDGCASMEGTLEPECACYGCTTMRHACIDEILNQGLTGCCCCVIVAV